jgi:hypothetical protein
VATSAETSARSSASSPAEAPENTFANCSESTPDDFPPLSAVRIGDTVRTARPPDERLEWTNQTSPASSSARAVAPTASEYVNLKFNAKDLTALPLALVQGAKDLAGAAQRRRRKVR